MISDNLNGYNEDLLNQINLLKFIIKKNGTLYNVLNQVQNLGITNYYIGGGCIAQTVWNYQIGNDLNYGISDIDLVYFDDIDLSFDAENSMINKISNIINNCTICLDINNQARVHLWYKEYFGYDIQPYISLESAINSWPTTATSIAVRIENGDLKIYAPFGLNDLFGMVLRANKSMITDEIYKQKVDKWKSKWPTLSIIPW